MGLLRFVLALGVLATHAGYPGRFGDSALAVQIFFMISGFLISFVLNRNAAYADARTFWVNRALRLFPVYWVVAAATALYWLLATDQFADLARLNAPTLALLIASNLAIFGQDAVMFLHMQGQGIALAYDFTRTDPQLWRFLLIPPAWSLSLELTFYLIAPFVLRRRGLTIVIAALSFLLTVVGRDHGLVGDPWSYRFFPFEVSLFLAGALAERWLLPVAKRVRPLIAIAPWLACAVYLLHPLHPLLPIREPFAALIALALIWALLPALFAFQRGRGWDVFVGDLSYSLYVCHALVMGVLDLGWAHVPAHSGAARLLLATAAAVIVAVLLERLIARPVERYRRRLRGHRAPVDALDDAGPVRPDR